ncbi:MAG: hypothetical protein Q8N09_07455, partial [Thermodesulfovibrionia bacterium]|nr:hypothetical protein [Thermodesulfovibrionia bacterium]
MLIYLLLFPVEAAADILITSNTTISADNTTYDNQVIIIQGCTVTIDGSHSFQSLTLQNNAVLTHSGSTTTTTSQLDLTITTTLTIDATS